MSDHQIHQVIPLCPRLGDESLADRRGQQRPERPLRARGFYDQISSRTVFLIYEMKILKSTRSMS
jgi:hypothetical protein